MERLRILIVGSTLSVDDEQLVTKSLMYYVEQTMSDHKRVFAAELLSKNLVFEDVVAKREVHNLRDHGDRFGYMLVLGNAAARKLESTNVSIDVVECHTLVPQEWGGPMRDQVIKQLREFVDSWLKCETESKVVKIAETDTHKAEWIKQNSNQLKRHIQLMIQNDRPHAAFFQDKGEKAHLILRDATKKLRVPIQEVIPVVADEKILGAPEKYLKKFEQLGYSKVFLMGIDEFMSHIMSMCMQMSGQPARIIVEPVDDTKEPQTSTVSRPIEAVKS